MGCCLYKSDVKKSVIGWANKLLPFALVPACLFLYYGVIDGPFVFDDNLYVKDNLEIRDPSILYNLSGTRYVTFLSFALNYSISGLDVTSFHLFNIIIHACNSVLVYLLVKLVMRAGWTGRGGFERGEEEHLAMTAAIASAFIFLVHPVQTQAVSYISQRFTSLATFFFLTSVVCYIKARRPGSLNRTTWSFYLVALLAAVIAQKTKEISFTLPLVIMMFELTFFAERGKVHRSLPLLIPFLLILLIIPLELLLPGGSPEGMQDVMDASLRRLQLRDMETISTYKYFSTQMRVIATYIRLMIYPAGLHFDYNFPLSGSFFEARVIASAAFIFSLAAAAVYLFIHSWRNSSVPLKVISTGVFWFFITLSVESSVIPIKDVISEHRLYLPSVGLVIAFVTAVVRGPTLAKRRKGAMRAFAIGFLALSVIVLSAGTYMRNKVWANDFRLYADEVAKNPKEASTHTMLAKAYYDRGMVMKSREEFIRAVAIDPAYVPARINLGLLLFKLEEFDAALMEFAAVKRLRPDHFAGYYLSGVAYLQLGMNDKAAEEFKVLVRVAPTFKPTLNGFMPR